MDDGLASLKATKNPNLVADGGEGVIWAAMEFFCVNVKDVVFDALVLFGKEDRKACFLVDGGVG